MDSLYKFTLRHCPAKIRNYEVIADHDDRALHSFLKHCKLFAAADRMLLDGAENDWNSYLPWPGAAVEVHKEEI